MFNELNQFLQKTDVKEMYDMSFIDLMEDDLIGYEKEQNVISKGYQLPIIFIEGKPVASGKVDNKKIYQFIKKL